MTDFGHSYPTAFYLWKLSEASQTLPSLLTTTHTHTRLQTKCGKRFVCTFTYRVIWLCSKIKSHQWKETLQFVHKHDAQDFKVLANLA